MFFIIKKFGSDILRTILKHGHMAKVYIEDDFVYKTYDDFYPEEWVDKEVYIHDILLRKTNLNITEVEKVNAHEIKMPFLSHQNLGFYLMRNVDESLIDDFVKLQHEMHQYQALELENAHIVFKRWIEMSQLSRDIKHIAHDVLETIEYENYLCHFDYQPSHVVIFRNEYYIMDWIHAKLANPILDIANTYVNLRLDQYDLAHKYLQRVTSLFDYDKEKVFFAVPLMAAIKMIETDDIFEHKVLTTLVFDPKNKDITK